MTNYEQKPTGWWQDSKGRAQPPGSYLDASLRTTAESPLGAAHGQSTTRWGRLVLALASKRIMSIGSVARRTVPESG